MQFSEHMTPSSITKEGDAHEYNGSAYSVVGYFRGTVLYRQS